MTTGRVRALAAIGALLLAFPLRAAAQNAPAASISITYKPPSGWMSGGVASSTYYVRDGDKVHTLSYRAVPPKAGSDVETYSADQISSERQRGADVVDEGVTTSCDGEPAHRWTVRSASSGDALETHVLVTIVTGGIATATYSHRLGVGDRRDALDAMTNLCPGPFANAVPAGWTAPKSRAGLSLTVDSPDSTSTFVSSYRVFARERFEAYERDAIPSGKVIAEHRDPCAGDTVHRVDVQVGGQIAEIAIAYLHKTAYRYVYTRPATHDADAAAERALTAFCRPLSPVQQPVTPA